MHVVCGSGQTGRNIGKCWFVRGFMFCTVHIALLSLQDEEVVE